LTLEGNAITQRLDRTGAGQTCAVRHLPLTKA
jgi:hypothetical protein